MSIRTKNNTILELKINSIQDNKIKMTVYPNANIFDEYLDDIDRELAQRYNNLSLSDFTLAHDKIYFRERNTKCYYIEPEHIISMLYCISFVFLIIGCSCYFSGWSNVGGNSNIVEKMLLVTELCSKTHNVFGYFNVTGGIYKCNVETGYDFDSKLDCLNTLGARFALNTIQNIAFDPNTDRCMTLQESSTLSKVGFAFLILFVILSVCVYSMYQKIVESIQYDNKLYNDNYELLKIILANNGVIPNNIMVPNNRVIPNNKVIPIPIPTAPCKSSSNENEIKFVSAPAINNAVPIAKAMYVNDGSSNV